MWDQADPVVGDACPSQIALLADGRHDKSIHSAAVLKVDVVMGIRDQSDTQFSGAARARCAWTISGRNKLIRLRIVAYLGVCRPEGESAAEDHLIASNPPNGDDGSDVAWLVPQSPVACIVSISGALHRRLLIRTTAIF